MPSELSSFLKLIFGDKGRGLLLEETTYSVALSIKLRG